MSSSRLPRPRRTSGTCSRAPRALVIEAVGELRELLALELELAGFVTDRAADGQRGLEMAQRLEPDAIVLDLMLPTLSGFGVARSVRALEHGQNVAIVALSGLTSEALRMEALSVGCDVYLTKPVVPSAVVWHVRHALAQRRSTVADVALKS
jgi:two-component system cell cycle response regulator DivK